MQSSEDEGARKIAELFKKCQHLHRSSYPNDPIDFDGMNVTMRAVRSETLVGSGYFANVYTGTLDGTKQIVVKVLKRLAYDRSQDKVYETFMLRFFRELNYWHGLKHTNVARMLGFTYDQGNIGFVSPWYPNGNLVQYLVTNPDASKPDLALDVARGLQYLHNRHHPLIHGDLKGRNIFVSEDGTACIGDFGISKQLDDIGHKTGFTTDGSSGTVPWMAPELHEGPAMGLASDIYSYAGVLIEIWCPGKHPYYYLSGSMPIMRAKDSNILPSREHYPEVTSDELWGIMCRCWSKSPADRPNISQVIERLHQLFDRSTDRPGVVRDVALCSEVPNGPGGRGAPSSIEAVKSALLGGNFSLFKQADQDPVNGSFFDTYVWVHTSMQMKLAFKHRRTLRINSQFNQEQWFAMAAKIWSTIDHHNILPFLGFSSNPDSHWVTPWMERGDLLDFVAGFTSYRKGVTVGIGQDFVHPNYVLYESFNEEKTIREIASGLGHIHSLGYIHGDLKAKRILIAQDGTAVLSISPLAQQSDISTPEEMEDFGGTRWKGPELLNGASKTTKSDVFAFAMVIVEVLTGDLPFPAIKSDVRVVTKVMNKERPLPYPSSRDGVDFAPLWSLASKCWVEERENRPSIDDALAQLKSSMRRAS